MGEPFSCAVNDLEQSLRGGAAALRRDLGMQLLGVAHETQMQTSCRYSGTLVAAGRTAASVRRAGASNALARAHCVPRSRHQADRAEAGAQTPTRARSVKDCSACP